MWFRSDLRMHDNAALAAADKEGSSLLAVRPAVISYPHPHFSLLRCHVLDQSMPAQMCFLSLKFTS